MNRKDGRHFLLDENNNLVSCTILEWASFFSANPKRRIVEQTDLDHVYVSTVFLGLDHRWGEGPPLVFETMTFSQERHSVDLGERSTEVRESFDQWRYSTWDDAVAGHKAAVRREQRKEDEAAAKLAGVMQARKDAKT
jgi:hypothetical protein